MATLLQKILTFCSENKYSDVHINSGETLRIRNHNGELEIISVLGDEAIPEVTSSLVSEMMQEMISSEEYEQFKSTNDLDVSYQTPSGDRFRVNLYRDSAGYSIALRRISSDIPTMDEIGLGEGLKELCQRSKGLVLVTGPTGSGKSTNLASMIDFINKHHSKHIITIEDPIEFAFDSDKALINQREIGGDTRDFGSAIRAAMREDPDVIMVGEMRDPETIQAAITLAETGHLVFSTLHTNDSVQTLDRIIDVFPADKQAQIRMQLSQSLIGVLSQRLLPRADKDGRIAAREILLADDAVRNLIIKGKTHQVYSVIETSSSKGMILMDKYLLALYSKGMISKETLFSNARDIEGMKEKVGE